MSLDRDKIRRTLENDDVLKARTMKDELCNEIQSAYLNKELPETYKVQNILEMFLIKITVGMPLSRNEESLFEPYLTKFVKFMTIVSIFREKNKKGMSYNDYVFNVLGKYLWSKHHPKNINR